MRFRPGASPRPAVLDWQLAESAEYQELRSLEEDVRSIGPAPYVATVASAEPAQLEDTEALDAFIEERGRRGIMISRYKGLGEMNASELWETTMNPDARTLLQVRIDDPIRADELFSVLMGDQVEPRRQFIEQNALNVRNLDIRVRALFEPRGGVVRRVASSPQAGVVDFRLSAYRVAASVGRYLDSVGPGLALRTEPRGCGTSESAETASSKR